MEPSGRQLFCVDVERAHHDTTQNTTSVTACGNVRVCNCTTAHGVRVNAVSAAKCVAHVVPNLCDKMNNAPHTMNTTNASMQRIIVLRLAYPNHKMIGKQKPHICHSEPPASTNTFEVVHRLQRVPPVCLSKRRSTTSLHRHGS